MLRVVGIILAVYLAILVLFIALTYLVLALDRRRNAAARLWRAAFREILWASWIELLIPFGLLFWPWWWKKPMSEKERDDGELPVIFLHGYGQTKADYYVMGTRFRASGRGRLFAFNYWYPGPVRRSAARLARKVEKVKALTGASQVHLIGHSLGGLVSRYYVERMNGSVHVRTLVAIASPWAGTDMARFDITPVSRDLCPESVVMKELGPANPPGKVAYRAAWSYADELVIPSESSSLKGAGEEFVVYDQGHLTLLATKSVAEKVLRWLKESEQPLNREQISPLIPPAEGKPI